AVPNLETVEMPAPTPTPPRPQLVPEAPRRVERPSGPGFQANLFGPVEAAPRRADTAISAPAPKRPRTRREPSATPAQLQQSLNFQEPHTAKTAVAASVYTDSPVAIAAHRAMAAAIDMAMAAAALAVFLATFRAAGAEFDLTKATAPYYIAAAVLISLFYRVLFCIANIDTPGVCWTGLRVVDFDGRTPSRRQRWFRLLGGFVSAIAAGIGLLWAMVDEERLTWHDRISNTFPTPRFY
ncbi:MAG TPA: RDD family protein, partial [Bryobacteraceae bacterium]|nr:RDD family protein [Bryobacteraceae bacterium]